MPLQSNLELTHSRLATRFAIHSAAGYNGGSKQFCIPGSESLACPYFMPVERIENGVWPHPARLPLGGGWRGHCTAPGHASELPAEHVLEAFCNLGYAGSCGWAPADRVCDAVRFSVAAPVSAPVTAPVSMHDKQSSTALPARILRLRFVREKNHLPVDHGDLEFDLVQAQWLRRHDDPRVQKMAECFLDSYLKKKA